MFFREKKLLYPTLDADQIVKLYLLYFGMTADLVYFKELSKLKQEIKKFLTKEVFYTCLCILPSSTLRTKTKIFPNENRFLNKIRLFF